MGAQTLTFPIYIDNLPLLPIVQVYGICAVYSLWVLLKFALKMLKICSQFAQNWLSLLELVVSCTSIFTILHTYYASVFYEIKN
jgi:hypothetical protein